MNAKVKGVLESHGAGAGFRASGGQVECGPVPGAAAFQIWDALRKLFPETGVWPIIRGESDEGPESLGEFDPEDEIRGAPKGSIRDILKSAFDDRVNALSEFFRSMGNAPGGTPQAALIAALKGRFPDLSKFAKDLGADQSFESFARRADASGLNEFGGSAKQPLPWPSSKPERPVVFNATADFRTQRPLSVVQLALVPVRDPSETAAVLGFGGWNDCPAPSVVVAALREWREAYGALPACMTRDVLECFVERPPQTEEAAFSLACEQWMFCEDIVSQGTQSVRALAIELWKSPHWFFWWD